MVTHPHGRDKDRAGYLIWKNYYTNQYGGILCNLEDAPETRQAQYQTSSASRLKD